VVAGRANPSSAIRLPRAAVCVPLPTPAGVFEARAFELPSGHVYVALSRGGVDGQDDVLCRLHSECLTGDALGSLRCDCGVQLRLALRLIAAEERGVLIYATGHEGRGIGLVNKLRSYVEQDRGADTVDANLHLGLPVDSRDYRDAAAVLRALGVKSVRLLTNNPRKAAGLHSAGIDVSATLPLATAPHNRNEAYLRTKEQRLGHINPAGMRIDETTAKGTASAVDVTTLLGDVQPRADRPYVVLKYAQTLDGRIATSTGHATWISGPSERQVSHALRAACDAVLVGVDTVIVDDPQLTVRLVPGASPMRVVLDSALRIPMTARIVDGEVATTVVTTARADPGRRAALRRRGVQVLAVDSGADGRVDLGAALRALRESGVHSMLVEGGARVITAMLTAGVVDRLIVGVAPVIIGRGIEAVGELGVTRISDGIALVNRSIHPVGEDVLIAGDVAGPPGAGEP
jgi:GTP cyclohydrolase II